MTIVKIAGTDIAYTKSASSGETGAKAAFVKNWWWKNNKSKYPDLTDHNYPGVSDTKHPDNIISVNKHVSPDDPVKLTSALAKCKDFFKVKEFKKFDPKLLNGSLQLMEKAKIDIHNYVW